jgi:hypothetical protein
VQDLPSTQIWEMSAFMLALYDSPDEVKAFQARFNDYNIDVSRRMIEAGADVILIYDDYGTTGSPLTSLAMWKEFSYPHLKKHIEAIHDAGGLAMLHSCGLQTPFLDYYVEAELDILQSFQPGAGNDFAEAYGRLGDRLTFSTGIDVQQGERMTPDELRDDILRAYRIGPPHPRLLPHAPVHHAGREHRNAARDRAQHPGGTLRLARTCLSVRPGSTPS